MSESTLDVWQDRIVGFMLGATIVILPLILHPAGYDAFRFPKVLVVRSAAVLLLMVYSARLVWSGAGAVRQALLRDRLVQISALLIGWCALAASFSPEPLVSFRAAGDVAAGLILFFRAVSHGRRTGSIRILWLVLIPGFVIVGAVLLQQLDLWHPLVTPAELERLPRGDRQLLAKAALLGNRNDVGLYLLLPLAVAIASFGQRRWTAAAVTLAIMIGIVVTTTLTAIAVGVGLLATQAVRELKELRRRNLVVAGILFVLTLLRLADDSPTTNCTHSPHAEHDRADRSESPVELFSRPPTLTESDPPPRDRGIILLRSLFRVCVNGGIIAHRGFAFAPNGSWKERQVELRGKK